MTQEEFLQILFNDLNFTRDARNEWLSLEFKRSIRYLDSMTVWERSCAIKKLKEMKEDRKGVTS